MHADQGQVVSADLVYSQTQNKFPVKAGLAAELSHTRSKSAFSCLHIRNRIFPHEKPFQDQSEEIIQQVLGLSNQTGPVY